MNVAGTREVERILSEMERVHDELSALKLQLDTVLEKLSALSGVKMELGNVLDRVGSLTDRHIAVREAVSVLIEAHIPEALDGFQRATTSGPVPSKTK
jgi:hypothetical protein